VLAVALLAYSAGRVSVRDEGRYPARSVHDIPDSVRGTPRVLDGDTLDFSGVRVRLFGIDAFERDQLCARTDGTRFACGLVARESLVDAIGNETVTCVKHDIDTYGRMVGVCHAGNTDLGAAVVRDGVALAYRHYSSDYVGEEEQARKAGRGVWAGSFEAPWDYRHKDHGEKSRG
jgi:endonuclease YncB( thermonuclease family)